MVALAERNGLSVKAVWGKFRDHHLSNATRSADWGAEWRLWCRRELDYQQERELRHARGYDRSSGECGYHRRVEAEPYSAPAPAAERPQQEPHEAASMPPEEKLADPARVRELLASVTTAIASGSTGFTAPVACTVPEDFSYESVRETADLYRFGRGHFEAFVTRAKASSEREVDWPAAYCRTLSMDFRALPREEQLRRSLAAA